MLQKKNATNGNKWPEIQQQKCKAIFKILKGLNVYQAKKVLDAMTYNIESNAIIN